MNTMTCIAMIRRITTLTSIRMTEVTHCPSFLFTGHFLPCYRRQTQPEQEQGQAAGCHQRKSGR